MDPQCYTPPMNNPMQHIPLSEAEFDRLEEILQFDEERGLPVEGVDGFFAALVCSPILARPTEWMPIVWGGEPPEWKSTDEAQEAISLLMRLWNQVASSIDDGSFAPLMSSGTDENDNEVMLPHIWCMGFVEGMRVHEEYWFDESNDELQELVLPIGMVAMDAAIMLGDAPEIEERLPQEKVDEFTEMLPDVVLALHEYWIEHPIVITSANEGMKPGRNDPCPCGSGKKFKHCHGASV